MRATKVAWQDFRHRWRRLPTIIFLFVLAIEIHSAEDIKIGCLLEDDGSLWHEEIAATLQLAADHINQNHSTLLGRNLQILVANCSRSEFQAQAAFLHLLSQNVSAVIGPPTSDQVRSIQGMAAELQVPIISFSATDPSLTSTSEYPFFFRMTQSDETEMEAISDVLSHFKWKEVIVVYSEDTFGTQGLETLQSVFQRSAGFLNVQWSIPLDPLSNLTSISSALQSAAALEASVFLVHVSPGLAKDVFLAARDAGLMSPGYAWLVTEGCLAHVEGDEEAAAAMQGVLGTRKYVPPSPELESLQAKWDPIHRALFPGSTLPATLSTDAIFAYDSLWLVAHALDAVLLSPTSSHAKSTPSSPALSRTLSFVPQKLPPANNASGRGLPLWNLNAFSDGPDLRDSLFSAIFDGVTGKVAMDSSGGLSNITFEIVNVVGSSLVPVSFWTQDGGLSSSPFLQPSPYSPTIFAGSSGLPISPSMASQPPSTSSLEGTSSSSTFFSHLLWPGNTTLAPRGWIPATGKALRIAVPDSSLTGKFIKVSDDGQISGFCPEVFKAAAALVNYPVNYQLVLYGQKNGSISYTGMLRQVAAQTYDGAVGDITITSPRSKIVDFTLPFASSSLGMIVPTSVSPDPGPWAFLSPFTPAMWGVLLGLAILTGAVFWYLEHLQNEEFAGSTIDQIDTGLWVSFTTLGWANDAPLNTVFGRFIAICWTFLLFIVVNSYTANLASILTTQNLTPPITSLAAVISTRSRVGFLNSSFSQQYLLGLGLTQAQLVPLRGFANYSAAMLSGSVVGVVDEQQYLNLFMAQYGSQGFVIAQSDISNFNWGFGFQRGSALARDISLAIVNMSISGQLKQLHNTWVMGDNSSLSTDTGNSNTNVSNLGVANYYTLFLILFGVYIGTMLIYAILVWRRRLEWRQLLCVFTPADDKDSDHDGGA